MGSMLFLIDLFWRLYYLKFTSTRLNPLVMAVPNKRGHHSLTRAVSTALFLYIVSPALSLQAPVEYITILIDKENDNGSDSRIARDGPNRFRYGAP